MKKILLNILVFGLFFSSLLSFTLPALAQEVIPSNEEETLEGAVTQILEEKQITPMGVDEPQLYQKLEVLITKGSLKDKKITIENGNLPMSNLQKYKVGDELIITFSKDFEGNDNFFSFISRI